MIRSIYCIYDKICFLFRTPMFAANAAVMIRDLGDEVRRGGANNPLADHPKDYCLHELGVWDDETGLFDLFQQSKFVVEISALIEPPAPVENSHDHSVRVVAEDHSHGSVGAAAGAARNASSVSPRVPLGSNPQVGMP